MKADRPPLYPAVALGVFLLSGACSIPHVGSSVTDPPHAFIEYVEPSPETPGIRLAVKDLIDVKGFVTTAGSQYLQDTQKPANRDAACLEIARERGAIIVGKTNLTEFAVGVSGANAYFGTPENPIYGKHNRVPGGSSSGSAVAVALGYADVALGTDTAGSIRVPAACCGIAGLKTTFGLIPMEGVYPSSPDHLDSIGPMARDVAGLVQGMSLLQRGFEGLYAKAKAAHPTSASLRIGRLYVPGTSRSIDHSIDDALEAKGFTIHRMDDAFVAAWQQADANGEVVAATGAWLSNKQHLLRPTVSGRAKSVLLLGEIQYLTAYKNALAQKAQWQETLKKALEDFDAIALPVLKKPPMRMSFRIQPSVFEARVFATQNTVAVNFAGNPALAIPILMKSGNFPVTSLQLVGPPNSEADLLNIGRLIEE